MNLTNSIAECLYNELTRQMDCDADPSDTGYCGLSTDTKLAYVAFINEYEEDNEKTSSDT